MDSIRNRKPTRLKEFDYSNGAFYYVTICTKNREEFFGKIENDNMILNKYGNIAKELWIEIPNHFSNCVIDEFIIMPNHIHGILIIDHYVGNANLRSEKTITMDVGNANLRSENKQSEQLGNADLRSLQSNDRSKMYLSKIIHGFKSSVTREIRKIYDDYNFGWQKSYYDHIIRNDNSLMKIRHYIKYNPLNWKQDDFNNFI